MNTLCVKQRSRRARISPYEIVFTEKVRGNAFTHKTIACGTVEVRIQRLEKKRRENNKRIRVDASFLFSGAKRDRKNANGEYGMEDNFMDQKLFSSVVSFMIIA